MNSEKINTVFISHHSSKIELTSHLSNVFKKNGIQSWYAPRDIHPGDNWDEAIPKAIQDCDALVLLFCKEADRSRQVKRELALADKYKKPVFWLRVEKVEPQNLGYYLTSTQWLDWLDERDETLETLIRDLLALKPDNHIQVPEKEESISSKEKQPAMWVKGLLAFKNEREAAECGAWTYFLTAHDYPDSSVILPTGRSGTSLFRAMLRISRKFDHCPFGEAVILSDTETFGVYHKHETSRTRHIIEMLMEPLEEQGKGPEEEQIQLLSGIFMDGDPLKKVQKTLRVYPPSIHAVSISPIGEILAYDVGTYSNSEEIIDDGPVILEVSDHTKKYIDSNQPSRSILSIGLGTALSAGILLILAFDVQKANAVKRLLEGPMTAGIPATLLRHHPNCYILTTEKVVTEAGLNAFAISGNPEEIARWIVNQ